MRTQSFSIRIACIYGGVAIVALVLVGKLAFTQFFSGDALRAQAEHQYVAPIAVGIERGTIFFEGKDGERSRAATMKKGYLVALQPSRLGNIEATYNILSTALPSLDEELFLKKARKKKDPYEELVRRLDEKTAQEVRALNLPGVRVYEHRWRYYPNEILAAHILGFVGFENNTIEGRYGVERYYDDVLAHAPGSVSINFFAELFANTGEALTRDQLEDPAQDISLTIEPDVQRFVEQELENAMEQWGPKTGGIIVMRPEDGAMTAMAARPAFDPNQFNDEKDYIVFANPLVENVYELGSIMKPLTMAMGIDAGVITPSTTYNDMGFVDINGVTIENYDGRGRGVVPMQEVLNQSLNTGAVFVMRRVGMERFADYIQRLKLGEETGIDLPNEAHGWTGNVMNGRNMVNFATASFGQGIAPTPIGMARALATLANGGTLIAPHITQSDGALSDSAEDPVFSQETTATLSRMLIETVDTALAHGEVALEHHSIAAKTGTAQVARSDGGGYYTDRYLHSFFGYFPAYDPEFLVFLFLKEPNARYASQTLTDPFMEITKFLINYYEIPPDR